MARATPVKKVCECGKSYKTFDNRQKFCSRTCAVSHNNKRRKLSTEHKEKISQSLKRRYEDNPELIKRGKEQSLAVGRAIRGKRKKPQNIFCMSTRTTAKVLRRLGISCSNCGWDEDIGDIHHINGRKGEDPHNHNKLSYLCPNCHRLAENGKIKKEDLITFENQVGDRWLAEYYG